ncbi:hypothetical protein H0H93_009115 [Arthromyces matolae]|nr:hypothetical protein H0H93_009115 [Arthromyces matolae]
MDSQPAIKSPYLVWQAPTSQETKNDYPRACYIHQVQRALHDMTEHVISRYNITLHPMLFAKIDTSYRIRLLERPLVHVALWLLPRKGEPTCLQSRELPSGCRKYLDGIQRTLTVIAELDDWRCDLVIWDNTAAFVIWYGGGLAAVERLMSSQLHIQHSLRFRLVVPNGPSEYPACEERIPVFRLTSPLKVSPTTSTDEASYEDDTSSASGGSPRSIYFDAGGDSDDELLSLIDPESHPGLSVHQYSSYFRSDGDESLVPGEEHSASSLSSTIHLASTPHGLNPTHGSDESDNDDDQPFLLQEPPKTPEYLINQFQSEPTAEDFESLSSDLGSPFICPRHVPPTPRYLLLDYLEAEFSGDVQRGT